MMDRNSIILVTGGAGFIGFHLCEYLLSCRLPVGLPVILQTGKLKIQTAF